MLRETNKQDRLSLRDPYLNTCSITFNELGQISLNMLINSQASKESGVCFNYL